MCKFWIFVSLVLVLYSCGPDLRKLESLKDPKISLKPDQNMLVMEITGDPTGQAKAVGKLFQTYYKLNFKGKSMAVAPRARWPKPFNTPRDQWAGYWGLPVGDEVRDLPPGSPSNARIEKWTYGKTAEILYIGPYSGELPAIGRLHKFIEDSGYQIVTPHEEEYIVGPGMFGPGNPEKYYTVIRYAVRPATNR